MWSGGGGDETNLRMDEAWAEILCVRQKEREDSGYGKGDCWIEDPRVRIVV